MANTKTNKKTSTEKTTSSVSQSTGTSSSTTKNVLDAGLREELLAGLAGMMSEEELAAYARSLLAPQLAAGLEGARQTAQAARLAGEQEIADLASALSQAVAAQQGAYRQNMADVETAALARGMGRSSYTLETLARQGEALSQAVRSLTDETARRQAQQREKIALAQQQSAATQARLNEDFAHQLAAKLQELRDTQRREYNQHYMTATSAALGKRTDSESRQSQQTSGQSSSTSLATGTTQEIQPVYKTVEVPGQTAASPSSSGTKRKQTAAPAQTTQQTAAQTAQQPINKKNETVKTSVSGGGAKRVVSAQTTR